jgi:uncharacterized protein YndB with AHSA1/START domain
MAAITDTAPSSTAWELVITRAFDAPRALVFKAWTEPARLVRWWGPQGFKTPSCKMDVRPGGAWRICMRSPEGTDHWVQGVFREVVEPERLAFTWAWEDAEGKPGHQTVVRVHFTEQAGKTRLVVHQGAFESASARAAHESGWSGSLDRLDAYLRASAPTAAENGSNT